MLFHSRIPPLNLWPKIEQDLRREGLWTREELLHRLFCGKPAISVTESGPRCEEHTKAS
jgi:hypothetical protein